MGSRGLGVFGVDEGGRGLMESRIGGGRSHPWIHGVMEGFAEKPQGKIKKESCPSFTIRFKQHKKRLTGKKRKSNTTTILRIITNRWQDFREIVFPLVSSF